MRSLLIRVPQNTHLDEAFLNVILANSGRESLSIHARLIDAGALEAAAAWRLGFAHGGYGVGWGGGGEGCYAGMCGG